MYTSSAGYRTMYLACLLFTKWLVSGHPGYLEPVHNSYTYSRTSSSFRRCSSFLALICSSILA